MFMILQPNERQKIIITFRIPTQSQCEAAQDGVMAVEEEFGSLNVFGAGLWGGNLVIHNV